MSSGRSLRLLKATCAALLAAALLVTAGPAHAQSALQLTSADFANNTAIPVVHEGNALGCTGQNVPLNLLWTRAPVGTKSFALSMVDYSAPVHGGFVHWIVSYIPATRRGVSAASLSGTVEGINSTGTTGYFGPCPPSGPAHVYTITVYALNVSLKWPKMTLSALQGAAKDHTVSTASLTGTFQL